MDLKHEILQEVYGYETFRNDQDLIIDEIWNLENNGILVVMATGGGKSILYQIPAMMKKGLSIVISPLISLMQDQVAFLQSKNIACEYYNSSLNNSEKDIIKNKIKNNQLTLLYIAPERFDDKNFMQLLKETDINIFAVDEAHCISAWGHDFRPQYRILADVIENIKPKQVIALTATATARVQDDICEQLKITEAKRFIKGFYRPDLFLHVVNNPYGTRKETIIQILNEFKNKTGIIYCPTRSVTDLLSETLNKEGFPNTKYHAGLTDDNRIQIQTRWLNDGGLIIATIAFGMGIDKSDVRFVIHNGMSSSIESYYQEIGRASRDGKGGICFLLWDKYHDYKTQKFFIDLSNPPPSSIRKFWEYCLSVVDKNDQITKTHKTMGLECKSINSCFISGCISKLKANYFMKTIKRGLYEINPSRQLSEFDFDTLHKTRMMKLNILNDMINLVEDNTMCRMLHILEYFNDNTITLPCGKCDICVR